MSTLTFESNNNSISRTQVYNMILESFGLYEEQVSEGLESDKQKKFDAKKKEVQDEITSAVKNIIKNSVDEVLDKYYDQFPSYIKNIDMKMSVGESLNEDSSGDDDVDTGVTIRVHMAAPDPFVMLGKDGKPMPPPPARTGGLHDRIKLEDKVLFIVPHKQIKDKGVKNKIEQDKYGRSRATRDTSNYKRNQI